MDKLRILLTFLILLGTGFTAGAQGSKSLLRFDEPEQKVDSVRFDSGDITLVYHFENISGKEVSVLEVHSTCGCFTGKVKKVALAPGERSELVAVFAPHSLYGQQNRHLTIVASDGNETILSSVGVSGYVIRDLTEGQIRYAEDLGSGLRTDTSVNILRKDSFGDYEFSIPLYNDTDAPVKVMVYPNSWRLIPRVVDIIPAHKRVDLKGRYITWLKKPGSEVEVVLDIEVDGVQVAPLKIVGTIK